MEFIRGTGAYILDRLTAISFFDILDIAIVSVIFYYIFKFISDRRAGRLAVGIMLIIATLFASDVFNMVTLNFLITNVVQVGIIGLVIVFQSELRSFLEKMGGSSLIGNLNKKSGDMAKTMECINNIAKACEEFSHDKTGALIVFERTTKLGDVIRTGTIINSDPAVFLIRNIFYNKAPLHDGALVIRDFRLCSAGCFLPLSQNENIVKDLGTRHRAAIGMSENSDSIVVVVSEETGVISVAENGELTRGYNEQTLKDELVRALVGNEDNADSQSKFKLVKKLKNNISGGGEHERKAK